MNINSNLDTTSTTEEKNTKPVPIKFRHDCDRKQLAWVFNFTTYLEKQIALSSAERAKIDNLFVDVLCEILSDRWNEGADGGKLIAGTMLCQAYRTTNHTIVKRYRMMAAMGMIAAKTSYNPESRRKLPLEIFVNSELQDAYDQRVPVSRLKPIYDRFAELYVRRVDCGDESLQGWADSDMPWGQVDADALRSSRTTLKQTLDKNAEALKAEAAVKKAKQREAFNWSKLGREFVRRSADCWQASRKNRDLGDLRPPWDDDFGNLGPEVKKQYRELVKIFEKYGGRTAGLAWMVFCGYKPKYDDKGKRIYDPEIGFAQNSGGDKPPTMFAKNFSQIVSTNQFKAAYKKGVNIETDDKISEYYGHLEYQLPRGQEPKDASKTGIQTTEARRDSSMVVQPGERHQTGNLEGGTTAPF